MINNFLISLFKEINKYSEIKYNKTSQDNDFMGSGRTGTECHKFGIMDGCKIDCPIFKQGKCEQQEENQKLFIERGEL